MIRYILQHSILPQNVTNPYKRQMLKLLHYKILADTGVDEQELEICKLTHFPGTCLFNGNMHEHLLTAISMVPHVINH